jgi:hypothetical protein
MKTTISATLLSLSLAVTASASASGKAVRVEITNLTNATYFTPLLIAAHRPELHLFRLGSPASGELQAMAEGGDLSGLILELEAGGGDYVADPAGGLLAPGDSASATLEIGNRNRNLSVTAMLLPTNDGFVGLNAMPIPRRPGVYTVYLRGYDAGTEANDELITGGGAPGVPGIPADPGGSQGTGGSGVAGPDHNPRVHVHRGVVGDLDPTGGPSDLDAGVHRWLSPVARMTVTVGRRGRR